MNVDKVTGLFKRLLKLLGAGIAIAGLATAGHAWATASAAAAVGATASVGGAVLSGVVILVIGVLIFLYGDELVDALEAKIVELEAQLKIG